MIVLKTEALTKIYGVGENKVTALDNAQSVIFCENTLTKRIS